MKWLIKTVIVLCIATLASFSLIGCSTESPSSVTQKMLDGVKKQDSSIVASTFGDSDLSAGSINLSTLLTQSSDDNTALSESEIATLKEIATKMFDYDYTIKSETVDGDTARVEVEFKTYNIYQAFYDGLINALSKAFVLSLSGASQEEIAELTYSSINSEIQNLTEKTLTQTTTFCLSKKDGKWVLDALSSENANAMFGNIAKLG